MEEYNYYNQFQQILLNQEELIRNQEIINESLLKSGKSISCCIMVLCIFYSIFFWIKTCSIFLGKKNV